MSMWNGINISTDWIVPPPKFPCGSPISHGMVFGDGTLLPNGVMRMEPFGGVTRTQQHAHSLSHCHGHRTQQKVAVCKKAVTGVWPHWHPDLRLLAFRTERNKLLLSESPRLWCLVKAAWVDSYVCFRGKGKNRIGDGEERRGKDAWWPRKGAWFHRPRL